ncbi:hypothetical protein GTP23_10045 [Pseudoduganella sp. FT93W]|uniref:Uncharacterized protein n=1 Tax=Duganella fentianensis TaxID=2692177 RepID=A0A845HWA4_9BURK|nr:hypothetical protein [Duganella fentianensis]MYN45390.1 hypothetical protein [Duganella fentianensis]
MNVIAAAVTAVIALAIASKMATALPRRYRARNCQSSAWLQAFPDTRLQDVREFLLLCTQSFSFKGRQKLLFGPGDRLQEIYRSQSRHRRGNRQPFDTLESELLARYGVELAPLWSEHLTLGDLYAQVKLHQGGRPA